MVAIGVESATAPAVAGCQGDREPKAAEDQDSEEVGRVDSKQTNAGDEAFEHGTRICTIIFLT